MKIWEPVSVKPDECYKWEIGPLHLYIINSADEWHVAAKRDQEPGLAEPAAGLQTEKPEDADWVRWVAGGAECIVTLSPQMPDRPVVVRPENPLRITAGAEARFFVGIPLWIRISVGKEKLLQIFEVPVSILSNTWFGEPTEGKLCYALTSRAQRDTDAISYDMLKAVCPLHVTNKSSAELSFERLIIETPYLSLYRGSETLITSEVTVAYKGEDHKSSIDIGKKAPPDEKDAPLVSGPREVIKENLVQKSFSRIASYTGI